MLGAHEILQNQNELETSSWNLENIYETFHSAKQELLRQNIEENHWDDWSTNEWIITQKELDDEQAHWDTYKASPLYPDFRVDVSIASSPEIKERDVFIAPSPEIEEREYDCHHTENPDTLKAKELQLSTARMHDYWNEIENSVPPRKRKNSLEDNTPNKSRK